MKTSVVIATYNGASFIQDQIRSIFHQTVKPDEIIIYDDCSTDDTLKKIEEVSIESDIPINIITNSINVGVSKAFERGVDVACGDLILFSDQDDYWIEDKIEIILSVFNKYNPCLIFSNAFIVDSNLKLNGKTLWNMVGFKPSNLDDIIIYNKLNLFDDLIKHNIITGMTMACTRDFLEKCKPFPKYPLHDYWLAINASISSIIVAISKPLVLYRQHSNNVIGVNKKNKFQKLSYLKKKHFNTLKRQIMLYESIISLSKKYDLDKKTINLVENYYQFVLSREQAISKSIFSVLKLKSLYKKYDYFGTKTMKKDLFYSLILKRIKEK